MRKKSDRWMVGVMVIIAIGTSIVFAAWALRLSGQAPRPPGASGFAPLDSFGITVLMIALASGAGLAAALILRKYATRRFVTRAISSGCYQPRSSPVPGCTFLALALGTVCTGAVILLAHLYGEDDGSPVPEASEPGHLVLALICLIGSTMFFSWRYRTKAEVAPLTTAGLAVTMPPPSRPRGARAFSWSLKEFLQGVIVEALFFGFSWLQSLIDSEPLSYGEVVFGIFTIIGGPGIISAVLLLCFLVPAATRWIALDALRQPSSLLAIGLVAGAFLVNSLDNVPNAVIVVATIAAVAGILLASVTCLHIMDSGHQPWLGFFYLGLSYLMGYLAAPDGSFAYPDGLGGWIAAIAALVYCLREARKHWLEYHKVTPMSPG